MGNHANQYVLVSHINGKRIPLFPVYDLDRATSLAMRLQKYHRTDVVETDSGRIYEITEVA